MMGITDFKNYLRTQINAHSSSSRRGTQYVIGMLTVIHIDVEVFKLLLHDEFPKINSDVLPVYFKDQRGYLTHIKRCCLIDLWAVAEIRIREIAKEKKLQILGRDEVISNLITEALSINENSTVKEKLTEALDELRSKFIEFPRVLSAVLKNTEFNTVERKEWQRFFDILRIMRNTAHNNFICTQTLTLRWKRHRIGFEEGKDIDVKLNCLKIIIKELLKFFEAIE